MSERNFASLGKTLKGLGAPGVFSSVLLTGGCVPKGRRESRGCKLLADYWDGVGIEVLCTLILGTHLREQVCGHEMECNCAVVAKVFWGASWLD